MKLKKNNIKYLIILIEITVLLLLTVIIFFFEFDIKLQKHFYQPDSGWYLKNHPFWQFGYHYGTLPAILLAVAALIGLILGWIKPKLKSLRRYFLLIMLTLIIGPGVLVNAIFKDHWGRPRPRQVQEFGGNWEFKEVWEPGTPGKGKSFPCGHCSMGFFFIALYYCFKQKHKALAYASFAVSIALGLFIGFARISQGGHFLSDVLWSWGLTFVTATVLYYFILRIPDRDMPSEAENYRDVLPASNRKNRVLVVLAIIVSIAIMVFTFLFSKPFYKESFHEIPASETFHPIQLTLEMKRSDVLIQSGNFESPVRLKTVAQGFGFPKYKRLSQFAAQLEHDTLKAHYKFQITGLFNEIEVQTIIEVDSSHQIYLCGFLKKGSIVIDDPVSKNLVICNELFSPAHVSQSETK